MIFQLSRWKLSSKIPCASLYRNYTASFQRYDGSDRLHSTDIAYKPNESGWGYTSKFVANYDQIFKSKKSTNTISNANNKEELKKKTKKCFK